MEKVIYGLLGFAVGVLVFSIGGILWSDYRDKKLREKEDKDDEGRKTVDEINEKG